MKKKIFLTGWFLLFAAAIIVNGQCLNLKNKTNFSEELKPYQFDGIINCTSLSQGQNIALYKTLFSDVLYRLKIVCSDPDNKFQIDVYDLNHNLLFSNVEYNYCNYWDFTPKQSLQVIVMITADYIKNNTAEVALITGYKE